MKSVVVVGGGIAGLCSAYYAAKRGFQVTVLERETAAARGCSQVNAGIIVPSHFTPLAAPGMVGYGIRHSLHPGGPFGIAWPPPAGLIPWGLKFWRAASPARCGAARPLLYRLHMESLALYGALADAMGDSFGLSRKGLLMLSRSPHGFEEEKRMAGIARKLGMEAHELRPAELAAMEPGVDVDEGGAVYYPQDAHLSPDALAMALRAQLIQLGVGIEFGSEVLGFSGAADRLEAVRTQSETWRADEFVLAAGAWSGELGRKLGLALPMLAGKGYSFDIPQAVQGARSPVAVPSIIVEARVAVTPMFGCTRVAGAMEMGPPDGRMNSKRINGMASAFCACYPAFKPLLAGAWQEQFPASSGNRPCTPDGLPYLGRTRRWENLVVAAGHAMMGLSLGAVTGKMVADCLAGEVSQFASPLLDPDRYHP